MRKKEREETEEGRGEEDEELSAATHAVTQVLTLHPIWQLRKNIP